jgi:hypothetical protein
VGLRMVAALMTLMVVTRTYLLLDLQKEEQI